ncbi:VCBS repeat-containing protein [Acrocarpospora sp. B8E8]|uniref:FG-GAP repeat domain-containing protein n=1 Tax=Acrocarpospora sp. B8E8 TaxID=3153572 RepID=UPI00325D1845
MFKKTLITLLLATATAASGMILAVTPAHASTVGGEITRNEVLERAQNWVDRGIKYNLTRSSASLTTDPEGSHRYGPDCSGFVSMVWHLEPGQYGGLNTSGFASWSGKINLSSLHDLLPGDALLRSGHIELFAGWKNESDHGQGAYVYSLNGTGNPDANGWENDWAKGPTANSHGQTGFNSWSDLTTYQPIRYRNIKDSTAPAPANDGHRIQFGDLNGDGLDDLVQVRDDKQVVVFWNSGANPNYSWSNNRSVLTGIDNPSMIRVGDFNGDNLDDILQIRANGNLVVFFNTGANPNFNWSNNRLVLTAITDSAEISVGDLNNDGLDDIVQTRPTGQVVVFWNSGANPNFSWSNNRAVLSAMAKDEVKVGDFNADGLDDILQTRTGGQVVAFWNSGANPNFSWSNNRAVLTAMNEKNRVKTGDLNGDGLDDLIQIRPTGQVVVFWNSGANPNFSWSNNRAVLTAISL